MKFPPLPPGNLHHGNRGKEERYQRVVNKKIEKKEKKERRKNGEGLNMDVSVFHGAREHDRICSSKYLHAWITITAEWKQCTRQWGGEGVEKVDLLIPTCAVWRRVGSEKKKKRKERRANSGVSSNVGIARGVVALLFRFIGGRRDGGGPLRRWNTRRVE